MGKGLHKLGQFAFSRSWLFIAGWSVILALVAVLAVNFKTPTSSAITIPGTKAQAAIDRASELFPDSGKGSGRIVFASKDGHTISEYKNQINDLAKRVDAVKGVTTATSPFVNEQLISKDGTIAYMPVQLKEEVGSVSDETLDGVKKAVDDVDANGLEIERGGGLVTAVPGEILGVGEIFGLVIALVVLVVTLGSMIAAGLPIISAVVGVGIGTAGLFAASYFFELNATTPVLGVMLGLAVGIDYSLFIINRYRTLVIEGHSGEEAAGRALGTAGNAVVFAALTVIIALAALAVVRIPFMTTMGLAGASSIAVAALVALTLIPAMLGVVGDKIFSRKIRARIDTRKKTVRETPVSTKTIWYRWGDFLVKHPWPALLGAIVIIAVIALPTLDMKMGLPTDQYAAKTTTERKAYDLISEGFGVGSNGTVLAVVEKMPVVSDADRNVVRAAAEAEMQKQVAAEKAKQEAEFQQKAQLAVTPQQQYELQLQIQQAQAAGQQQMAQAQRRIDEAVEQNAKFVQLKTIADRIAKEPDVESAQPVAAADNGTNGLIQITPKTAPNDDKTHDLIAHLRSDSTIKHITDHNGATIGITGSTALQNDINAKLAAALPQYLAVVVGLSLVLLIVAFRSLLVPLKATLGFLLSILASFGGMVAVFQWGWFGLTDAPAPLVSFIPIISIGVLFGLAMDYEFFLVSGMHEAYTHTKDAKKAVVRGFAAGSKVVVAAAIIMISVFGAFVTNHDATIQTIGFGLALGILVDAFLVRMTIVPAVMSLLGRSAWWLPKWLDRRLPHVSIEGEEG